jgi:hypothetical protein
MAKKQKNEEVNTPQEVPQPTVKQELTNEEKELIKAAMILTIAERRKGAIAVTLNTLAKRIEMMLPKSIDINEIKKYVKEELANKYKITIINDKIGNDQLQVEVVLLYNTMEELLDAVKNQAIDLTIKVIDASLDTIADYK